MIKAVARLLVSASEWASFSYLYIKVVFRKQQNTRDETQHRVTGHNLLPASFAEVLLQSDTIAQRSINAQQRARKAVGHADHLT